MIPLVDTPQRRPPRTKTDIYLATAHALVGFVESCETQTELAIPGVSAREIRRISRAIIKREGLPILVGGALGKVILRRVAGKHMRAYALHVRGTTRSWEI